MRLDDVSLTALQRVHGIARNAIRTLPENRHDVKKLWMRIDQEVFREYRKRMIEIQGQNIGTCGQ